MQSIVALAPDQRKLRGLFRSAPRFARRYLRAQRGTAKTTHDPARPTPDAIAKIITEKTGFKAEAQKETAPKK